MNNLPELTRQRSAPAQMHLDPSTGGSFRVFTVLIDGQSIGLPIECVRTVFRAEAIAPAPLAPVWVRGLINLRGHVVTALSLRARYGLSESPDAGPPLAVGVEINDENFALIVDAVGDVIEIAEDRRIETPPGMSEEAQRLTLAVYALPSGVMPVLDVYGSLLYRAKAAA
ncbi:MAG: chemotaxis protein CheW [Hyphomicrobiales bacterium]|nr:chemotaxis protein CheW [Hyphomicrobiales bacterium]